MAVTLDVMAKPWSLHSSGSSSTYPWRTVRARWQSSPSRLQVTMRCAQRPMRCSASSRAPTLSGELPERAKCTMRVGLSDASVLAGTATISVVAMASTRRELTRTSAGARHSPTKDELPAPVRTTRSPASASSGGRKVRSAVSAAMSRAISRHRSGCCAISRAVAAAPRAASCPAVSPSASTGSFTLSLVLPSVMVSDAEDVGAAVGTVADAGAAQALADLLPRSPGQERIAVEIAACDRVGEILPLGIDLEAAPMVVQARRDPVEGIGDRGPPRHLGALAARHLEARLVIPVDIRRPGSLLIEQPDRVRGRRRRVDGTDEVPELIVAAGTSGRELRACSETVLHDVLPGELDAGVGALVAVGRRRHRPQERNRRIGRRVRPGCAVVVLERAQVHVRL